MSSLFNGKLANDRSNTARHFDKVILSRLILSFIIFQLALVWLLIANTTDGNRITSIITRVSDTLNYGVTTVLGFLGGIMTGKAMEQSRATDITINESPKPPEPEEPPKP